MGSETVPSACYIHSDESSIPSYSTSNGYKNIFTIYHNTQKYESTVILFFRTLFDVSIDIKCWYESVSYWYEICKGWYVKIEETISNGYCSVFSLCRLYRWIGRSWRRRRERLHSRVSPRDRWLGCEESLHVVFLFLFNYYIWLVGYRSFSVCFHCGRSTVPLRWFSASCVELAWFHKYCYC